FVKKFVPAALADQVVPTITCPTDIVQDAGPQCFISVTLTDPIASDNVSTVFTFEGVRSDGAALDAPFPIGNTTITWTAKDEAGNVSESCEQLVTVTGTGDCWAQVGPSSFPNGTVVEVSLALDGSGVPYLAFQDKDNEKKAT
ncbi:HYR domain-containing protein, partial [Arenibacter sp. F26102]|uniref:HYR domain-containing protein n=1 Tax=Arenibacter sp. F26102 TaxID=2926416 RepID=UPI001FF33253